MSVPIASARIADHEPATIRERSGRPGTGSAL